MSILKAQQPIQLRASDDSVGFSTTAYCEKSSGGKSPDDDTGTSAVR